MTEQTRRLHERFNCDMAIWLRIEGTADEYHLVEVQNISAGGVLCLVHYAFSSGDILEIHIEMPQRENMVNVKGIVRHVMKHEEEDDSFIIGIQFTEVDCMTVPAFMAYIEAMFV